jgi:hypothetical protein
MIKKINNFQIVTLLFLTLLFVSCEKVIDIDLKDSKSTIVIEGEINEGDSLHTIRITKSSLFGGTNTFPNVKGAVVSISDDQGNYEVLSEVSEGIYSSTQFKVKGIEGRTYSLNVESEGKVYTSTSTIPKRVNLDYIFLIDNNFEGNGAKTPVPIRQDPAGIQNNYLFKLYIKRAKDDLGWVKDSSIMILDDNFSDGIVTQQPLFGTIRAFMPKDSVRITMTCIDRNVYKYFFSFRLNGQGVASPANPISNISGGALGFFSAQTKQTLTTIVK